MRGKMTALMAAVAAAASAAGAAKWLRGRQGDDQRHLDVSSPEPPTSDEPSIAATAAPAEAAGGGGDDLTAIRGLGKVKAAKLVASGITSYAQIAAWTEDDIAEVGLEVNTSPGQIKREDWVGQAKVLAGG